MEAIILITAGLVFAGLWWFFWHTDDTGVRSSRDALSRWSYDAAHRQRHSVWQRAGHVYGGDAYGPFGKACAVFIGFCLFAAFVATGFNIIMGLPLAVWFYWVRDRMGWS